jgi:hypothetical protein
MRLAIIAIFLSLAVAAIVPARKAFTILPIEPAPRGTFIQSLRDWIVDTGVEVESQNAARKYFESGMNGSSEVLRELNIITCKYQRFSPFLYYLRANEKHQLKDHLGALKDYDLVLGLCPNGFPGNSCHFWKGDIFEFEFGDNEQAELEYTKFINSQAPNARAIFFNRGSVRQKMGKYREAIEDYTHYSKYIGGSLALGERAECYLAIGDKRAARADALKVIASKTAELKKNNYPCDFFERGKMRILIGDVESGKADLEITLKLLRKLEKTNKDADRQDFIRDVELRLGKLKGS